MKLRSILVTAGLVVLAFALGVLAGWHFAQPRVVYQQVVAPGNTEPEARPSAAPAETPVVNGPPACVDFHDASQLAGKNGCVTGLVLKVYSARSGNTFLDFCEDYRSCPFTSVIFAADKDKFGDLGSLQGQRVEVRGGVVTYQGHTEVVIHDPRQLRGSR